MNHYHIPYHYNNYTDTLLAIGTARLLERLYNLRTIDIELHEKSDGFHIIYPEISTVHNINPFNQIKDKEKREIDPLIDVWDKTAIEKNDAKPSWWSTVSTINTLASPKFNNDLANTYSLELGQDLLTGSADLKTGSKSQLLYAQASKGVNKPGLGTTQGNLKGDAEQMLALLGYQTGGAGFIRDNYTISIIPRPKEIHFSTYLNLVNEFLRPYLPKASSGKYLPTQNQTVPFFIAMAYFDFIIKLFNYFEDKLDPIKGVYGGVGDIITGLDRVMYYKMGTGSAPFVMDTLAIPDWLDRKSVAENIRDLIRAMLGKHTDPKMLYLPVRAFAERDPQPLVEFYRLYEPLEKGKRLLEQETLEYIMEKTGYEDLNSEAMHRFARALRSRTLTKLYGASSEPPDYELLTKLRGASLHPDRLINMLSEFVGSYNLRNARLSAVGKPPEGPNLNYQDLQTIIGLIQKHGAKFIANTLMAQAMSKRPEDVDSGN
jgi:hypothetical protein